MFDKDDKTPAPRPLETPENAQAGDLDQPKTSETGPDGKSFRERQQERAGTRAPSAQGMQAEIEETEEARAARKRRASRPERRAGDGDADPAAGRRTHESLTRKLRGGAGHGSDRVGGAHEGGRSKLPQVAMAGIVVLGLAGVSLLAAEGALRDARSGGDDTNADGEPLDVVDIAAQRGEASANALSQAATNAATDVRGAVSGAAAIGPTPWFDYRGMSDMLLARKAEYDANQLTLAADETAAPETTTAALAVAEAEALEAARDGAAQTEAARLAADTEAAEIARLADLEAARIAETEAAANAQRLADQEAAAQLAAARAAELDAARLAEAEAEATRLAEARDLAAQQATQREAAIEAERQRQIALNAERAAEAEAAENARLAKAEADAKARADRQEAARLAAAAAAEARAAQTTTVAAAPTRPRLTPQQLAASYSGPMPTAASLKPARATARTLARATPPRTPALQTRVASSATAPPRTTTRVVDRTPPMTLKPGEARIRSFTQPATRTVTGVSTLPAASRPATTLPTRLPSRLPSQLPTVQSPAATTSPGLSRTIQRVPAPQRDPSMINPQLADAFLGERVQRYASAPISAPAMADFRTTFLGQISSASDGQVIDTRSPDGQAVKITVESTRDMQIGKTTIRTIDTSRNQAGQVLRYVSDVSPQRISIMCRDITYAIAGSEQGRFAACQLGDGRWKLARAGNRPTA